jgi:DNA-binding XRE family transcriptional regulator
MVQGAEKGLVPSVAIDGARIRSVRESKKLTQLYVASVVGVTTDTISRWENNRYPSIKRDNAEKLAGALEVELSEILRKDEAPEMSPDVPAEPPRSRSMMLWMGGALILAVVAGVVFSFARRPASPPTAVRWIPKFAAPGDVVPVQIKVTRPPNDTSGFILKERLPDGMRLVSSLPPDSATESARSNVKWLIPDGKSNFVVSYTVKVPDAPALTKEGKFSGEIVLRKGDKNRTEAIGGDKSIEVGSYHWADSNGDRRIDDNEIMPAYYICEEMKGMGLDWKIIEAIWSGKGYRWEAGRGFQVVN